ncbi:Esterase LipI [Pseudocercospora fuligena]|uniref:Esterase LipI n=1 Tax=Pseudocercospora fuligena TaxID=685502 RepID=A0A8H6VR84_9PEZI|nr:Esterase LipI [Pseudocercospora fuligena]
MATGRPLPGRLGDLSMSLATDRRTHRGLLKGLIAYGMQHNSFLAAEIIPDMPMTDIVAFARQSENELEKMIDTMEFDIDHSWLRNLSVQEEEIVFTGSDRTSVRLITYRPKNEDCPAIVYFHGGGMVMLRTESRLHTSYAKCIAKLGFMCILVDFRNVLHSNEDDGSLHHFPAGLNDCVAAVQWIYNHRIDLKIDKIILHGDSGGANLALATALKLKTESIISGVFVIDPYISGAYSRPREWKLSHLPSLIECDGYDVSCSASSLYARLYDNRGKHEVDSLAWPYWATEAEMQDLPPHLILVAELDPLRDEGVEYCRRLERAGVRATGRVRMGMTHTGELLLRAYVKSEFLDLLGDLRSFVDKL